MQGTCLTAVVLLWEIFSLNHQSLCLPREHSSGIVLPAQRCISPSGVAYQHLKGTLCFPGASHVLSLLATGRARMQPTVRAHRDEIGVLWPRKCYTTHPLIPYSLTKKKEIYSGAMHHIYNSNPMVKMGLLVRVMGVVGVIQSQSWPCMPGLECPLLIPFSTKSVGWRNGIVWSSYFQKDQD